MIAGEKNRESEQTPEEIRGILEGAAERGLKTELTVRDLSGKSENTNVVAPYCFTGNFVTVETDGSTFDIELSRITKAEIVE